MAVTTPTTTTRQRNTSINTDNTNGGMSNTMSRSSRSRSSRSSTTRSATYHSSSSSSGCSSSSRNITAGRILFVSCLVASAVLLGYFAHDIIASAEAELAHAQYHAIADRALDTAEAIALRKTSGTKSMASILQNRFPNASVWPFVALEGYEEIATNLIETSDGRGMGFCPLVEPGDQALEFEAFAYDYFDRKFGPNHTVGISSFGKGIYAQDKSINSTDNRFLDRDGRYWNPQVGGYDADASAYRYLSPMLQHNNGPNASVVMRNIRNDRSRGPTIDKMMDCVASLQPNEERHCGTISEVILASDGSPSAFIYEPILPVHSNKLTGFIVSSIRWSDTFSNIFTEQVSGIDLVVHVGNNETYTYTVNNGNVTLVGKGDHHNAHYDQFRRSISLTQRAFQDASYYTLTLYPQGSTFETYSTKNPIVAAIGVGCIIVFTSLMFFVYDCLVSRNIREKGSLLEAKREFMRYVSHEVRTPLNTVCMGLKLLQDDIRKVFGSNDDKGNHQMIDASRRQSSKSRLFDLADESTSAESVTTSSQSSSILQLSDEILTAANSAVGVLNDFLNYDKIENKSLKLDLSVLNIWHDLERALLGFKLPAEAKDIDLQLDLSSLVEGDEEQGVPNSVAELPVSLLERRVVGDGERITQVFRNLLSNGLKFTEKGGSITVTAKWIPPPPTQVSFADKLNSPIKPAKDDAATTLALSNGKQVVGTACGQIQVAIKDTGAGMTPEQLEQVFAAGVQFNVNVLQKGQGSGLGMYIAKEIVAQHGGSLVAESEGIGKGATFTMTLPLYDIPDDALPEGLQRLQVRPEPLVPPNVEDPEMCASPKPFEPLRVLVVDDAATNRKLLRRLLERRGHICEEAKDGSEAVDKVLGESTSGDEEKKEGDLAYFDTILLDYEMPICNGPDCVARLRQEGCDSFVVGITGNVLPEDISHFKACGANEVLHKPVDLDALGALWMEYGISGGGNNKLEPMTA